MQNINNIIISKYINNYYSLKQNIFYPMFNNIHNIKFNDSNNTLITSNNIYNVHCNYELLAFLYIKNNNNYWVWSSNNPLVENNLSQLSKCILDTAIKLKNINLNFDIPVNEDDINKLLKFSLYYSQQNWIIQNNINSSLSEFIIIKNIYHIS